MHRFFVTAAAIALPAAFALAQTPAGRRRLPPGPLPPEAPLPGSRWSSSKR